MRFFLGLVIVLGIMAAGAVEWVMMDWTVPGPAAASGGQSVALIVPHTSVHAIAEQLENAHLVSSGLVFEFDLHLHGLAGQVKAGEYAIPSKASMADIAAILISGKSIQHKLTAAEGLTSDMIAKLVAAEPALVGDMPPTPAEGTLLPETYLFTHGTTRAEILSRMRMAQQKFLAQHWAAHVADLPFRSQSQAVIMASIVEKETSLPEERRHIAAVFINRLKAGMKLQSDPTIIYGLTKGYPLGRPILASEITGASPWNTYVIDGLPDSPICNPGKDSLAAVLDPEQGKDLYFVASGRGGHVFAATLAEHQKNVIAYRAQEKLKDSGQIAAPPPPKLREGRRHA